MRKFILLGILFGAIVTFFAAPYIPKRTKRDTVENVRATLNITCMVRSPLIPATGTGVLLDTGYVLTAGHNIDLNRNEELDEYERDTEIEFTDGQHEGKVVYFSAKNDFAIVELCCPMEGGATASKRPHEVGDRIYTVGATGGHPPTVTDGYIVTPGIQDLPRASCYISGGNSGGGLFDSKRRVLGIVVSVGIKPSTKALNFMLPLPDGKGKTKLMFISGTIREYTEVNNNCIFSPIAKIRSELDSKRLGLLLDKPREPTTLEVLKEPRTYKLIQTLVHLGIFLWVLFYVRRHVVGTSVS